MTPRPTPPVPSTPVPSNWVQVTPSEFPWEQEALSFVQQALPTTEPYAAWANFEVISDGSISEIDLLICSPKGVFLVEIKSWPGSLVDSGQTWRNTRPDGKVRTFDNPLLLTNRKAKKLKSLLGRQKAFRRESLPYIAPAVFLSSPELSCNLSIEGRQGIFGRGPEPDGTTTQRGNLPSVIDGLITVSPEEHRSLGKRRIDRPMAKRIATAMEQIGLRPEQRSRKVGELELGDLLDEGVGYQDFAATHPRDQRTQRRVRIYGLPSSDPEERDRVVRAADREFKILGPLQHPNLMHPVDAQEHELGAAVVFERDPSEQRLDHFLAEHGTQLDLYDRLSLLRSLGETVAWAHGRRIYHRSLSPRNVLVVRPRTEGQHLRVGGWQTGVRLEGGTLTSAIAGTQHVLDLVDDESSPYIAPEAVSLVEADPERLDVFSIGAIGYHVLTGVPPAATLGALTARLQRDKGLEIAADLDGAANGLAELIRGATAADASHRFSTVADLLEYLDEAEEELTRPPESEEPEVDPLKLSKGDRIGTFTVQRRLGRGSTAIAVLAKDADDRELVLKIASTPEHSARIREEGEVLGKLRDSTIIPLRDGPLDFGGHAALVLGFAGNGTLARWLSKEGSVSLGKLEDWGTDLLSAVAYLEREGIAHRDIKPENLGIAEVGPRKQPRLVLLDFSLSRAPTDQLEAGTRPYLDPFLGTGGRDRWDLSAERFSAAVVLHQMAAGTLPFWGDRSTDPRFTDANVTVDERGLPEPIRDSLTELLQQALHRDATKRFDTADDLLRAWRLVFADLDRTGTSTGVSDEERARLLTAATAATPVRGLGLDPRAVDALERAGIDTVAQFLDLPPLWVNQLRGVSLETRRVLGEAQRGLRQRLAAATTTAGEQDVHRLVDLCEQLLPRRVTEGAPDLDVLRRFLTLNPIDDQSSIWPGPAEVASATGVSRTDVVDVIGRGRRRWVRLPALTRLRNELVRQLEQLEGIAEVGELERALGAWWQLEEGSDDGPIAVRAAVRAAVEAELERDGQRVLWQRTTTGRVLVVRAEGDLSLDQRRLDAASALGSRADALVDESELLPFPRTTAAMRSVTMPSDAPPLGSERLVRLATSSSARAGVSSRLELHRVPLRANRALALSGDAVKGSDAFTIEELQRRVAARFPAADQLPGRPALDALLRDAGLDLRWEPFENADGGRYEAPSAKLLTSVTRYASSVARADTVVTASARPALVGAVDPAVAAATAFERRVEAVVTGGGLLSLLVDGRLLDDAVRELQRWPVTVVDLDAVIVRACREAASSMGVAWDIVLRADAAEPGSKARGRLARLIAEAMPSVEAKLDDFSGVLVVRNLGLLARYGQLGLLDRLRTQMLGDGPLRACVLLLPADEQGDRPQIDGHAVPALTPNEWARVPRAWLKNLHRGAAA